MLAVHIFLLDIFNDQLTEAESVINATEDKCYI